MNALNEPVIRAELAKIGLRWANCISWNAGVAELYQQALERGEARVAEGGTLSVMTGAHTGRSPKDKFIVRNAAANESVWWDNTSGLTQAQFDQIKSDMLAHARLKSLFVQDLHAGADPAHRLETRVIIRSLSRCCMQISFTRDSRRERGRAGCPARGDSSTWRSDRRCAGVRSSHRRQDRESRSISAKKLRRPPVRPSAFHVGASLTTRSLNASS